MDPQHGRDLWISPSLILSIGLNKQLERQRVTWRVPVSRLIHKGVSIKYVTWVFLIGLKTGGVSLRQTIGPFSVCSQITYFSVPYTYFMDDP